jgi:hypothetical protein
VDWVKLRGREGANLGEESVLQEGCPWGVRGEKENENTAEAEWAEHREA